MASPLGLTGYRTNTYQGGTQYYKSIINDSRFYYRPDSNIDRVAKRSTSVNRPLDADDVYDISTNSIIDYTNKPGHEAMNLKPADFAYLRDLGVYPNNRLIAMRRFSTPVPNDLTTVKHRPISTILGWVGEDSKSFGLESLEFGEKWESGESSLTEILSDMLGSKEVGGGISGSIGSIANKFNEIPMPGMSRGFQYDVMERLGVRDVGDNIPDGNPNFIQESMKREIVGIDGQGSGLKSDWVVDMTTTYEQKFISGNDPSIVFLDIMGNLLRFGTSKSEFFINGKGGDLFKKFFEDFKRGDWVSAIGIIVGVVSDSIEAMTEKIASGIERISNGNGVEVVKDIAKSIGDSLISKYKVRISSVIASWTGQSSAPWHVTIGNPKKPFFSSGDMVCDKVKLKFGTVLAFNDLPSTIEVYVSLKPARNLGLQELFERFNTGAGRSYIALSDTFESDNPNQYWNKWWDENPKAPTHTANDGLSSDATKEEETKKAQEKAKKDYEEKKKNEIG